MSGYVTVYFASCRGKVATIGDAAAAREAQLYVNRNNAARARRGDDSKPYRVLSYVIPAEPQGDPNHEEPAVTHQTETIRHTTKETAAEIRKALRTRFPDTKFSLRMSRGTAYGYMDLTWTDGPTPAQVKVVTDYYQSSRFDGMDDMEHPLPDRLVAIEGHDMPVVVSYSCRGVSEQRRYSPEAEAWAEAQIRAAWPDVDAHCGKWSGVPVRIDGRFFRDFYDLPGLVRSVLYGADLSGIPAGS